MRLRKAEMRTFKETVERYVHYTGEKTHELADVIRWAAERGELKLPKDILIEYYLPRFSEAMRQDTIETAGGAKVRVRYCLEVRTDDDDGQSVVRHLWSHIDDATPKFIRQVFAQRITKMKADIVQIKTDLEYVNANFRKRGLRPIQLRFEDLLDTADTGV